MRSVGLVVILFAGWVALCASAASVHAQKPEASQADIEKAKQHYGNATAHQEKGEYQKAAKEYLAAYDLYPDPEFLFNVGEVYRLAGDDRRAVEYFEKYLALDPNGRGSADARASVKEMKPKVAAEDAEAARKRAAAEAAAAEKAAEDADEKNAEEGASATPPSAADESAYPSELVLRPIQLLGGQVEAGGEIQVFSGPGDNEWQTSLATWIGFAPRVAYGITDEIQVAAQPLLLPIKPSDSDFDDQKFFGGITAAGQYSFHEVVSARLEVGVGVRGRLMSNPYVPPLYPSPLFPDMAFGFRVGASVKKSFQGRVAVSSEPSLAIQMDSTKDHEAGCSEEDPWCVMMARGLHLPVAVHYQATPTVAAGIRTGVYTGSEMQLAPDDGASYPLLAELLVALLGRWPARRRRTLRLLQPDPARRGPRSRRNLLRRSGRQLAEPVAA